MRDRRHLVAPLRCADRRALRDRAARVPFRVPVAHVRPGRARPARRRARSGGRRDRVSPYRRGCLQRSRLSRRDRTHGHAARGTHVFTGLPRPRPASLCGDFLEYSMPARDFAAARRQWEAFGFVAIDGDNDAADARGDEALPWQRLALTSDHLNLAFHAPRFFRSRCSCSAPSMASGGRVSKPAASPPPPACRPRSTPHDTR